MKQIGMLYASPMVQAILEGRKTKTRRVVKNLTVQVNANGKFNWSYITKDGSQHATNSSIDLLNDSFFGIISESPYHVGDVLWVKEKYRYCQPFGPESLRYEYFDGNYSDFEIEDHYKINNYERWRPSLLMPKRACRIFLEVTKISVEKLQNISPDDAVAEGIDPEVENHLANWAARLPVRFFQLWNSINGEGSWEKNPWVWVIEFKKIAKPEVWP